MKNSRKLVITGIGSLVGVVCFSSIVSARTGSNGSVRREDRRTVVATVADDSTSTSATAGTTAVSVATTATTADGTVTTVELRHGADDAASHDVNDDKGVDAATTAGTVEDNPARIGQDDTSTASTSVSAAPAPAPATAVTVDDNGGQGRNRGGNDAPNHG